MAFCRWLSEKLVRDIRLPGEAEWVRAAGGKNALRYLWGDATNFAERCNCDETGLKHTSAVGLFPCGNAECGVGDLAGNVWEWCGTAWLDDYEDYEKKASDDLEADGARVLRGGSWSDLDPNYLLSSLRRIHVPDVRWDRYGFRCVCVARRFIGGIGLRLAL